MAKNSLLDWSTTAASNTDVGGININEGCPAANINNAMRETMAQVKSGVDYKVVPVTKGAGYTAVANDNNGIIRFSAAATLSLTAAATLAANWHVTVVADGGDVVIDPNSAETINGAATITIPNGYSVVIWCTGSAFLATKDYATNATALALKSNILQPSVDVASATTTDIGAAASENVRITGTTTITGLGTAASGTYRRVRFAAALTLTYNATSLILPGAVNITTVAGDVFEFVSEGSGNWRCVGYLRSNGEWTELSPVTLSSTSTTLASSIPAGVTDIELWWDATTNGSSDYLVRIGTGGSEVATGYASGSGAAGTTVRSTSTTGFVVFTNAVSALNGKLELHRTTGNKWISSHAMVFGNAGTGPVGGGVLSLAGALDIVRVTTSAGTPTLSGSIQVRYR